MTTRTRTRAGPSSRGNPRGGRLGSRHRYRPPWWWTAATWTTGHILSAVGWAARTGIAAAAGHAERIGNRISDRAQARADFGGRPYVTDLTTGQKLDAQHPDMYRHLGMTTPDGAAESHRFREDVETTRLSRWERFVNFWRIVETHPDDIEQRRFEQWHGGKRGPQTTDPPPPRVIPRPSEVRKRIMANDVKDFNDLVEPDIHPLEYPEQLPEHIAAAARLAHERAADQDEAASEYAKDAENIRAYRDYMETAELDASVLGELSDAADQADGLAKLARQAAEGYQHVGDSLEAAARAADAKYGDQELARFDKANDQRL